MSKFTGDRRKGKRVRSFVFANWPTRYLQGISDGPISWQNRLPTIVYIVFVKSGGLLLQGSMMIKTIVVLAVLSFGIAQAQEPLEPAFAPQAIFRLQAPFGAMPLQPIAAPVQQVVNLGDVVINVVIAKVLGDGKDAELTIAKFGGKEANPAPRVVTTYKAEQRTRKTVVNGETREIIYTVQVPVSTVSNTKENFTPTEQDRSVPVSAVKAFDLKGNPISMAEWTSRLGNSQHVLLLREPINETNKLNPFYAAILREDTLLWFLKGESVDTRLVTVTYNAKDLPIWEKDGEALEPTAFIDLIKAEVTPKAWSVALTEKATIRPFPANKCLLVTANQATHEALASFLRDRRKEIAEQANK